jgi:hypothetical protein
MFLGGLTARAINLTKKMNGTEVRETYPRKLLDILQLPVAQYKNDKQLLGPFTEKLKKISGAKFNEAQINSWHHLDAFLALLSGFRYLEKNDQRFGIPEEGIIIV